MPPLFGHMGPGGMDAAAAAAAMGYLDPNAGGGGAGGAPGGGGAAGGSFLADQRFMPPPPPGMGLPPGFPMPPPPGHHPHGPPPLGHHPMGPFGGRPLPPPEEIQAKLLELLPGDAATAVQWDASLDGALDGMLHPLAWGRDLAHVYGPSPVVFMSVHPELFSQRQVRGAGRVGCCSRGGTVRGVHCLAVLGHLAPLHHRAYTSPMLCRSIV